MSILRSSGRVLKMAGQNSLRNFWLSVITISMYMLTLLTVNVVLFVSVFASAVTHEVEKKVEVTAYFKPDTSLEIVDASRGYMLGFAQVREANVVTSEEAYEAFRAKRQDNEAVIAALDEIGDNPFGHALVIRAVEVHDFNFILDTLDGSQYSAYIEETDALNNAAVIDNLSAFSKKVQYAGIALSVFFGVITFLILFNTIRMAVYVHREEIAIMKLVGASDAYVRMPFLIEGFMYGLVACALFFGGIWMFLSSGVALPDWFDGVDVFSQIKDDFPMIIGVEILVAMAIAFFATWVALARHLKV